MLNNLTNFFNLIVGRRVKTTANPDDLVALGVRDPRTPGIYQPVAIKVSDLVPPAGVTAVTGTSPVVSSGGSTPAISMPQATTSVNGFLRSTDFNTFNNKVSSVTGTSPIISSGGTTPAISIQQANSSQNGFLSAADWNSFAASIRGLHLPFGVASGNYYTNTVVASQSTTTITIVGTGTLGLTPFKPSVSFTANAFSINVTALTGGGNSGRVVVYQGAQDGTVTLVHTAALNILATGLATVNSTFTFVAGNVYWLGWNCNFYQGSQTMTGCSVATMAPLMLQFPVTTPSYNTGYSTTSFTTSTPPATINLSTYTKGNSNNVQIYMTAQ